MFSIFLNKEYKLKKLFEKSIKDYHHILMIDANNEFQKQEKDNLLEDIVDNIFNIRNNIDLNINNINEFWKLNVPQKIAGKLFIFNDVNPNKISDVLSKNVISFKDKIKTYLLIMVMSRNLPKNYVKHLLMNFKDVSQNNTKINKLIIYKINKFINEIKEKYNLDDVSENFVQLKFYLESLNHLNKYDIILVLDKNEFNENEYNSISLLAKENNIDIIIS